MSSLLSEPFLLANYPIPSQKFPQSSGTSKIRGNRNVLVKSSCSTHGGAYATVTVQGDGIHILELSNMHATVSHTLGPSAFFATPAVTRLNGIDASTSYAVMRTAPDGIEMEERDKTVWKWRDRHTRRPDEQPEPKQSVVFPHPVGDIWAPEGLPSNVIAVSSSGDVMLLDEDLKVTSSVAAESYSVLLKSFVVSQDECTFLSHNRGQHRAAVVLCFTMVVFHVKLRIVMAYSTGELEEVFEYDMGVYEAVNDISCDPSGYITILDPRGNWQFFRVSRDSTGAVTVASLDKVCLTGLSVTLSGGKRVICEPTIIAVGSSFVLFAGISGSDPPDVVLLLWDIQYAVVLASQRFALPSTVVYSPKSPPMLELVPASSSLALLVLSTAVTSTPKRMASPVPSRSTVLVVPLTTPTTSTIALAIGKARDTRQWLRKPQSDNASRAVIGEDKRRRQAMQSVRKAMEKGLPQDAETAFFTWVEEETPQLKHLRQADTPFNGHAGPNAGDADDLPKVQNQWEGASGPFLSRQLVSSILNGIMRPLKPLDAAYPSKIVQYFIRRQAVSHAMVEGGLLPTLRHHQDWESIIFAFNNVHDLPESDIICILVEVVGSHRLPQAPDPDEIQVDAPSGVPSLPDLLAMVVGYASSPTMLRLALKHHLTDARDILCILQVLEGWLDWRGDTNAAPLPHLGSHLVEETQPLKTGESRSSRGNEAPPLGSVLAFLQCILDVHFLTILQYAPCHSIIENISQHLHEELLSVQDLDRLRGPLEAFTRSQFQKYPPPHREHGEESRQRRKEGFEAAEIAIGLYQIEELVI